MDPKRLNALTEMVAGLKAKVITQSQAVLIAAHHQLDAVEKEIEIIREVINMDVQKASDALEERVAALSKHLDDIRQSLSAPKPGV